jgi:sulfate adenylyltransferase subunit 1
MEHLDKGNRVLFRLRDLEQLPAVAQVAYEQALSFEFDRTVGGISILLFKRGTAPQLKPYGDDGVDI